MKPKLNTLEWDSNFFETNVARVHGLLNSDEDLRTIRNQMMADGVTLAYYISAKPLPNNLDFDDGLIIKELGSQCIFVKSVPTTTYKTTEIADANWESEKEVLTYLAIEAGSFSRFNRDEGIGNSWFEALYSLWIENSFITDLADQVYVCRRNRQVAGMITLGSKDDRATIGLIAVHPEFRGEGVAKSLLEAADYWAKDKDYSVIEVVTQEENIPACQLYRSFGYQLETKMYVYHFWNIKAQNLK